MNQCGTDECSEEEVMQVADAMLSNGMVDAGYVHVNLDDELFEQLEVRSCARARKQSHAVCSLAFGCWPTVAAELASSSGGVHDYDDCCGFARCAPQEGNNASELVLDEFVECLCRLCYEKHEEICELGLDADVEMLASTLPPPLLPSDSEDEESPPPAPAGKLPYAELFVKFVHVHIMPLIATFEKKKPSKKKSKK